MGLVCAGEGKGIKQKQMQKINKKIKILGEQLR